MLYLEYFQIMIKTKCQNFGKQNVKILENKMSKFWKTKCQNLKKMSNFSN